jgi:protease-4
MSRKKIAGLVIVGVIVASIALLVVLPGGRQLDGTGDAVAVVALAGPIQETGSASLLGGGAITPQLVRNRLQSAQASPRIKAVVLRVDSPGGTVGASQEIAGMIGDFDKPIVVSMGDTVASGGYYISSQADAIVAQPGTLTGSIGVIWASFDPTRLFRKLGIEIDAVTAGRNKDMFLPGRLTPDRRRLVQRIVNIMYDQFVSAVARGRDLPESRVRKLATGELYTGRQALGSGLVDELGGLDEALDRAEELAEIDGAEVVELSPSLFEQLFGSPTPGALQRLWDPVDPSGKLVLLRELLTNYLVPRYGA